jgi:peptide/nickel transport system substrate-binding protein
VKAVSAADRYTVVVTLRRPDPNWLQESSLYRWEGVFEKKFFEQHKSTYGQAGTLVMGTGPWRPVSLDATQGAELSANARWWGGRVPIRHISIKFFSSENSMALAFRAGAVDVASASDPRSFAAAANTKLLVAQTPLLETFVSMNTKVAPWSDVHVRRAVAYAVNRSALINALGATGYARPVPTLIDPLQLRTIASKAQVDALLKSIPLYPFDPAKAKQEMAASAYPNGFSADLTEPSSSPSLVTVGEALAGELKPLGIKLTITTPTIGNWFAALTGPAAQRPLNIGAFGAFGADPAGWDAIFLSRNIQPGQENFANYTSSAVDALAAQEEASSSQAKRLVIFKKLLLRLQTDLPYIALYSPDIATALSSKFTWPTYSFFTQSNGTWPLEIKPR